MLSSLLEFQTGPDGIPMHRHVRPTPSSACRSGAAAVELAMVTPIFLLLLSGIIEFGQVFRIEHSLSNAARRGARAATVDGVTTEQVESKVIDHCIALMNVSQEDITVTTMLNSDESTNIGSATSGDEITVKVSVPYSRVGLGFFASMLFNTVLHSSCTMERE